MEQSLPTDEEFLDSLFQAPASGTHVETWLDAEFVRDATNLLRGAFPASTDLDQYVTDMFDPAKAFRGAALEALQDFAQTYLNADEQYLRAVPVGMLLTGELNGAAYPTPRGGAVIVIDKGLLLTMGLLTRCMLALTSWSSPEPYCRDHSPADFVAAILCLANFEVTGDARYLGRIKVQDCPSLDPWDMQSVKVATILETFALLHEYGHIACGHVAAARSEGYADRATNHAREFEADQFAFDRLAGKLDLRAVGIVAVTFFRFLDLIEHVVHGAPSTTDTHPSARDRWHRLRDGSGLRDESEEHVGLIDSMFDMILRVQPDFIKC